MEPRWKAWLAVPAIAVVGALGGCSSTAPGPDASSTTVKDINIIVPNAEDADCSTAPDTYYVVKIRNTRTQALKVKARVRTVNAAGKDVPGIPQPNFSERSIGPKQPVDVLVLVPIDEFRALDIALTSGGPLTLPLFRSVCAVRLGPDVIVEHSGAVCTGHVDNRRVLAVNAGLQDRVIEVRSGRTVLGRQVVHPGETGAVHFDTAIPPKGTVVFAVQDVTDPANPSALVKFSPTRNLC